MEKEKQKIKDLEQRIIETTKKNEENKKIKNIKIFKERLKAATPFVLSGTLALTYFSVTFDKYCKFPAPCTVYTTSNQYQMTMYIDDSDENYNCGNWTLDNCSKWYKNEDGSYSRTVNTYQNNSNCFHSQKELEEIVLSKSFSNEKEHFQKEHFVTSNTETKTLSEEELKENSDYTEITIDAESKTKEVTKFSFLWFSTLMLLSQLYAILPYSVYRKKYLKNLKEIRKSYSEQDIDSMLKELQNLKNNQEIKNKELIRKFK